VQLPARARPSDNIVAVYKLRRHSEHKHLLVSMVTMLLELKKIRKVVMLKCQQMSRQQL
jgi:hypothetical protein